MLNCMHNLIANIFGIFLTVMAVTQLFGPLSLQHALFNHGLPHLIPFPLSLTIICLEVAGAIGVLLMDDTNMFKDGFIKAGIAAGFIWLLLFVHMLLRGMDTLNTGFFGNSIEIPFGPVYLLLIVVLIGLGIAAYRYRNSDA